MDIKQLFIEVPPEENPDWGFARNRRALLRTANAEFSQGVFSAELGDLVCPNRDYAFEGLSAVSNFENWKFLDGLAFGLTCKSQPLKLKPTGVRIFPWKNIFSYSISGKEQGGVLQVEFYLLRDSRLPVLNVTFRLLNCHPRDMAVILRPLADIRHMYRGSDPGAHLVKELADGICISKEDRQLFALSKDFESFAPLPASAQRWQFKLGSGSREIRDGAVCFASEERSLFIPGDLFMAFSKSSASIQFVCATQQKSRPALELSNQDEKKFIARLRRIQKEFALQTRLAHQLPKSSQLALCGRLLNLLESFGIATEKLTAPDAGAYWFRNIWFRDAFQGINDNFDLFYKVRKAGLKALILRSLEMQKNGLIPNKLPESRHDVPDYSSVDATLLCFIAALNYLKRSNDRTMQAALKDSVKSFLESLSKGAAVLENYLIRTPASFSWMDSKVAQRHFDSDIPISTRLPKDWAGSAASSSKSKDEFIEKINSPSYYLVELNALWIRFLMDFNSLYPSKEFETLQTAASINFKSFFFSENPCAIMDLQFVKAREQSSASIYSAALLPELFSEEDVSKILRNFETSLVYRNRKLFGVLTRNDPERIFLGDAQYHGAVIWPRDSLWLLKLLSRIQDPRALEILESNLEHQMEEGAVFFNHELFALPEGNNPYPRPMSYSPVPVRNPAQFWSQWVLPYFEYFEKH